jgi:serine/threonine protein kinase
VSDSIDELLRQIADFADLPKDEGDIDEKELPDRIGEYQIIGWLGAGGSGIVYRAREPRSGRDVALKIVRRSLVGRPDVVKRFCEAAEITAPLEHRNVVRLYDTSGLRSERPFYTMQLVNGSTLARPRHRGKARTPSDAAELMIKVADAIHFAH